jgi:fatty-acyl-CoA synthase
MAVPMFHANGWGLPFAAPAIGAKLVLPGRFLDGRSVARLMCDERVSLAAGVPTVWLGLLDYLDQADIQLPALRRVIVGGSQCPQTLIERLESRLGIIVQTSWGMTELSPLGTISAPDGHRGHKASAGRPPMGLDLKLTNAAGERLPQQRGMVGHLKVKGASVVDRYFGSTEPATDHEGYFDTGDLAIIDPSGELIISGRSKDLIKSGGEWINPTEIEDIIGTLEAVALAAVIGRPDAKWGERPILVIELHQGHAINDDILLASLRGRVADWWIPDAVLRVTSMPLAATGKIDKVRLRADFVGT